ncbi:MAG TPA: tRNA (adenosine(37)-N6)-threonylcarbamoyltransferase complex ATPase subunit type 1 TsaE [Chloroflexota bacterium]|nr:tRNA (adenosine(37)-N6)-threonylcarbamoyltransferase complex ATPase subunit type 1 TsaE [Chloroflexota bacterium]
MTTRQFKFPMEPENRQPHAPEADLAQAPAGDCLVLTAPTAEETQRLGALLGRALRPGDLLLLQGPIGAGKTTFAQGLARGMGLENRVTSPSFTLANVYEPVRVGACPLYHLDLWRIKNPLEALGIGLDEYLAGDGVCVIEWPDVAEDVLSDSYLRLRFTLQGDSRQIELCPAGARATSALDELRAALKGATDAAGD